MSQAQAAEENKALTEILRVISSSPGDLQLVFDTILSHARRLCGGSAAVLWQYDGTQLRFAARNGGSAEGEAYLRNHPLALGKYNPTPQAALEKRTVHVLDVFADRKYRPLVPKDSFRKLPNATTILAVPLLRQNELLGVISIWRFEKQLFTRQQVTMVEAFASQAAMAIHNVRLHNEISAALERQTATAEILKVISSSPTATQPVFESIVQKCHALYHDSRVALRLIDDGRLITRASTGHEFEPVPIDRESGVGACVLEARTIHLPDLEAAAEQYPRLRQLGLKHGYRSGMFAPLLREGRAIGGISVLRREPGAFSDKDVALLTTFADQAVIAIENARLFNETKEALEQQTATSEILRVISSSPTDVQPVFDAIARSAVTLCGGMFGCVFRYDGQNAHFAAHYGFSPDALEIMQRRYPRAPQGLIAPILLESAVIVSPDVLSDSRSANPELHRALGVRGFLGVPMLLDGRPIGAILVFRREPGPFSDAQIAVLQTFADQAVIAIENARLFNETKEALERQTATSDVLRVMSGSPTDVQPVLDSIAERAAILCNAKLGFVARFDGKLLHAAAFHGASAEALPTIRALYPMDPGTGGSTAARVVRSRAPVQIADVFADAEYAHKAAAQAAGYRSALGVPLLREGEIVGAIIVVRAQPGLFPGKQVEMLETFADQAVIAIENVRLFNQTKEALEQQTAISEVLRVISASPIDVQPVLDAVALRAARICDASDARIFLIDGGALRHVAGSGDVPMSVKLGEFLPLTRDSVVGRAVIDRAPLHIEDFKALPADEFPVSQKVQERSGWRTNLCVPLLREDRALGAIVLRRMQVRPFTDKQIGLVKTFADQAAIAIENVRLFNELQSTNASLREALEQQTATSELLKVIGRSNFDLQPVFDTLVENAVRLCGAERGFVFRFDGQLLRYTVGHNVSRELREFFERNPIAPGRNSNAGRAAIERRTVHNHDVLSDPEYSYGGARVDPYRTVLAVPMFRADELLGVIVIYRHEVRPFTVDQIALMETFADQAAIAIENVRLFNETKEALERQTATAEILKVISRSPSDIQPVFDAVAESTARLCDATDVIIRRIEGGGVLRAVTHIGSIPLPAEVAAIPVSPKNVAGRAVIEHRTIHIHDVTDDSVRNEYPEAAFLAQRGTGFRTLLVVPLVRNDVAVGLIAVRREEKRPFSDQQIGLLQTFADQAVIAIENVRLFNETREALERQTATAEILKVIAGSPSDVQPVFDAIAASAQQLIGGLSATVTRVIGDDIHLAAFTTTSESGDESLRTLFPVPISGLRPIGRAILTRAPVLISDIESGEMPADLREVARARGFSGMVAVPMIREGVAIGAINVTRRDPGPFTDHQVNLLKTFADQAVIAIENVRLFKELRERTEALTRSVDQLTALGEVGQAISSTLDLETVLKTIVSRAVQLTGLDAGAIYEYDEATERFQLRAAENIAEEVLEVLRSTPIRKGEGAVGGTAVAREPIQVLETQDESYRSRLRDLIIRTGRRALLAVPLLHEERIVGALAVHRNTPGPFAPEVVDLLKTFATQSALAIQNARLFREIAEKGRQLEVASHHKSQFLASMSHELRTPLNALLGFNEMILGDVYGEVPGDMKPPLAQMQASGRHLLRLINNVLDLAKIEAGRMELALSDYSVHDTVESVRSALRPLAADKGVELLAAVPEDIPLAHGDAGRITQCLMNLAGNSLKFTKAGKVQISVMLGDGRLLRYSVADTGIGIPADKIDSLFTEFKQTDATIASEYGGTGLGLSITKKFVEMHGGRIWVESEPGCGSTFSFEIPLRAQEAKAA